MSGLILLPAEEMDEAVESGQGKTTGETAPTGLLGLAIVDEADRMSASGSDHKRQRYRLGELLRDTALNRYAA